MALLTMVYSTLRVIYNCLPCDSDQAGDPDDRRSTSRFVVFPGQTLVSWSAKKQLVVSRSSIEAEYRSIALTTATLFWLCMLFNELQVPLPSIPILWCDNVSALALASNPLFHARTKHIEVDYHFVREKVLNRDILVKFISTIDQVADILTKALIWIPTYGDSYSHQLAGDYQDN